MMTMRMRMMMMMMMMLGFSRFHCCGRHGHMWLSWFVVCNRYGCGRIDL